MQCTWSRSGTQHAPAVRRMSTGAVQNPDCMPNGERLTELRENDDFVKTAQDRRVSAMTVLINRLWCKGCGICVAFCPKKALALDPEGKAAWSSDLCVACGMCERYCPDLAIELEGDAAAVMEEQ